MGESEYIAILDKRKTKALASKIGHQPKWGEVVNGVTVYPCHDAQLDVLAATRKHRFTCGIAGTGGGKSVLIPLFFALQIKKNPTGTFLLVIPHYKHLIQSGLLDGMLNIFKAFDPQVRTVKAAASYDYFQFTTGAKVFIRSAENPEAIEGVHAEAAAMDEVAKISAKAWQYTRSRVDGCGGPVLLVTTPDQNNWLFTEHFRQFRAGNPNYYIRQWASADRPGYDLTAIENARLTMSAGEFARRYGGQFVSLDGLVYETFEDHVIEPPKGQLLPSVPIRFVGGIDWGWEDPLSILVGAECQDGKLYIVEEFYGQHIPIEQVIIKCRDMMKRWGKGNSRYADLIEGGEFVGFYADHSRPETFNALQRAGVRVRKKKVPLIEAGIAMVDSRVRTGFLKVYNTCTNLIEESRHYQRAQDRDGDFKEKPIDKHNHAMDCLRYLITGLDYGRRLNFVEAMKTEDHEEAERARLEALNLMSGGDEALKELEEKRMNEQFWQMVWGD